MEPLARFTPASFYLVQAREEAFMRELNQPKGRSTGKGGGGWGIVMPCRWDWDQEAEGRWIFEKARKQLRPVRSRKRFGIEIERLAVEMVVYTYIYTLGDGISENRIVGTRIVPRTVSLPFVHSRRLFIVLNYHGGTSLVSRTRDSYAFKALPEPIVLFVLFIQKIKRIGAKKTRAPSISS